MRVGVQRERDLAVSERLHDRSRVGTLGQEQSGARVPKVVESKFRQFIVGEDLRQGSANISRVGGSANRGREHQSVLLPIVAR